LSDDADDSNCKFVELVTSGSFFTRHSARDEDLSRLQSKMVNRKVYVILDFKLAIVRPLFLGEVELVF